MGNSPQYVETASGPTIELALIALASRLKFDRFGVKIDDPFTPGQILPRADKFFQTLIEKDRNWTLTLGSSILKGKQMVEEDVLVELNIDSKAILGCGPSIHFALIALLSELVLVQPENQDVVTFLTDIAKKAPARPPKEYIFQMIAATRFGTGAYKAKIETQTLDNGLVIYTAKLIESI